MKKFLLLMIALLTGVGGAWAALSSSSIAKSGNVTDTWNILSALPTDNWTAMGEGTPKGVKDLGSYTAYSRTQNITLSDEGALSITFLYSSGSHQLEILGVDLLNSNDEVIRSDYHYGKTGTALSHNVYMLDHIASGDYKIRFIINSGVSNSVGNITVKHINIKTASSFAEITNWYFVRMHSNQTHYMYYKSSSETGIDFTSSSQNNAYYLWGFVKDVDGIKIYNKAAGGSVAIDNANPCTLSASGTSLAFTFGTGSAGSNAAAAGAYFSLYMNPNRSAAARSYLNYRSDNTIQRWSGNDEGSTWMIDEVNFDAPFVENAAGKIYKLQAYFSNSDNLYFTNNGTNLAFNTSASSGVNDYWILRSSGNGDYPWRFESGRGDGKFLSNKSKTEGLSETGVYLQINNTGSYFNLRGSNAGDAKTTGIVNLGTWTDGNSGFGAYGTGGCWASSGDNDTGWSTKYIIEEVTGFDIYTVVSNINAGGVTYTPSYTGVAEQTNGGFYILASAPSASDFTAISVDGYTAGDVVVDATAKTITVNYTANITYTLTDANGQEYEWSVSGTFGIAPTLTGCAGLTVSNEVWNEEARTYTADIAFPFPVSSNSETNYTYIGCHKYYGYENMMYLYAKTSSATDIRVQKNVFPTNESGENERYKWAIIPAFSDGAFSFTIKNASTGTYITSTSDQNDHSGDEVSLSGTGTPLQYKKDATYNECWYIPSTNKYLSVNSYDTNDEQFLGTWNIAHSGTNVAFIEPADFATLLANLKTAYASYDKYFNAYIAGSYTQSVAGKMETAYANNGNVQKAIADPPTKYLKASEFTSYIDAYNAAINGLRYVMPTFFRVKNLDGTKYAKERSTIDYANLYQLEFSADGTEAKSIFYLNASNNIISYYSGSYLFSINHTKPISYGSDYLCTYEFLPGSDVNRVYVHVASNPKGWGGEEKYWIATDTKVGRGTAPTANSDFLIEEVTSLPVSISDNWASFCAPVKVKIPDGVKAYKGTIAGNVVTLTSIGEKDDVIPANTGVLLYATSDNTYNFEITTAESTVDVEGNNLTGTTPAKNSVSDKTTYVLGKVGSDLGFYQYKANNPIPGFRSFFEVTGASSNKFTIVFADDDDVTAVAPLNGQSSMINGQSYYDLQGRKVKNPQKGNIYILNGKKVLF